MSAPTMSSSSTSTSNIEPDAAVSTEQQSPAVPDSVAESSAATTDDTVVGNEATSDAVVGNEVSSDTVADSEVSSKDPAAESPTPPVAPKPRRTEFEKLQKAIPGTSYKDLPTLLALQRRLQALMELMDTPEKNTENVPDAVAGADDVAVPGDVAVADDVVVPAAAIVAAESSEPDDTARQQEITQLATRLEQLIQQHHEWQRKTVSELEAAVVTLTKQLGEGKISESQSLWDRSQSALRRVNEEDQARLQEAFAPLRTELTKLLDWRKFASSEKKKELIDKMQALVEDETAPPQKARLIRALQDEWKTLGHSEDNDALWSQFSEAARLAFEPCKQYFRERKELQAANLVARNNICEQLEAYVLSLQDVAEPDLSEINRLEQQARDDWKKYAPVAQNKIKALQKRFNTVLSQLRHFKRTAAQHHNAAKSALIEQAKALLTHEDLADAIRQSKDLQQQWKALGPGSFRDDRKLWTEFRAACDALFARRDENRAARNAPSGATAPAKEALKEISDLLALDDEAFAESRPRFNQASKSFRSALTPELRGGERKALQDQFTRLSKRYDMRQRLTPDRKQLLLQQQVQQRAALCQSVEEQLLKDGQPALSATDLETQWTALDKVDDGELEQVLQKRFKQIARLTEVSGTDTTDSGRQQETRDLAEKLAPRAREICVDAEIMSGAETPAEDKAVRMQLQLNQLQKGLGRLPTGVREQLERLQQAELLLLSTGPLEPVLRSTLKARLDKVRQRFQ